MTEKFNPEDARALVVILDRPYGNLTGAEKREAAATLTAALAEIERLQEEVEGLYQDAAGASI